MSSFIILLTRTIPFPSSNNSIRGILIDSENHLWAYTWGVGINELNLNIPHNQTFQRHIREDSIGLEGDFLSSACEDTMNNGLWFGTTRGLTLLYKKTKRFFRVCLTVPTMNSMRWIHHYRPQKKHRMDGNI